MKNKKFWVVTGTPRSGTSALMTALRESGIPICGFKYPLSFVVDGKTISGGSDVPLNKDAAKRNPTGMWEIRGITRQGQQGSGGVTNDIHRYDGMVVKVVDTALFKSDATLMEGVLYCVRDPRVCLSSQMNLNVTNDKKRQLFPWAYIINTAQAFRWIKLRYLPYMFVPYEQIIEQPTYWMSKIIDKLGRGEVYGAQVYDKRYNRTEIDNEDLEDMDKAVEVYQMCVDNDIDRLLSVDVEQYRAKMDEYFKEMNK